MMRLLLLRNQGAKRSILPSILSILLFIFLLQQFWMGIMIHNLDVHHHYFLRTIDSTTVNDGQGEYPSERISIPTTAMASLQNATIHRDSSDAAASYNSAFLIFHVPPHPGQGTGNLISGLLAAHKLGQEFHRTVCHTGFDQQSFDRAFRYQDPQQASMCAKILRRAPPSTDDNTIVQNNFDESAVQSECAMRDLLHDHTLHVILYYRGNTYPRWPSDDEPQQYRQNYFHMLYQPTTALQSILPWQSPPRVVVHLRMGDNFMDRREGLDNATLALLAEESFVSRHYGSIAPDDKVFLVSNKVEWYDYFPDWDHPPWALVHHSALGRISWGTQNENNNNEHRRTQSDRLDGLLQMWADWYTLLNAKIIVHTHSDFSLSAARWNEGIDSYTIHGTKTTMTKVGTLRAKEFTELDLQSDFQLVEGENTTKPLVDRAVDELQFCHSTRSEEEEKEYKKQKLEKTLTLMKARRQQTGLEPLPVVQSDNKHKDGEVDSNAKETRLAALSNSFLIYHHISGDGQGAGNIISGVLAAHLLAKEFNRTICHYGLYRYESSMGRAFRWKDDRQTKLCEKALDIAPSPNANNTIVQRNYDRTAKRSECEIKDLLSSHDKYPILYYNGNTYPRWPSQALSFNNHHDYFHEYYRPTQALLEILPWNVSNAPSTVIHLRQGDSVQDHRSGLDEQSLTLLTAYNFTSSGGGGTATSQQLPRLRNNDIFLVTNKVEWYHRFPNWTHPSWDTVPHSSFGAMADWGGGSVHQHQHQLLLFDEDGHNQKRQAQEASKLQLWADWYTLVRAQQIYHTHSDFSLSAARWNRHGITASWTIQGSTSRSSTKNNNTIPNATATSLHLLLQRDFEAENNNKDEEGIVPPLVERSASQLKYC